ncbi:MAG TPA: hypothetical protein VNT42_06720, partial [Sphingomonas sp.]|nr:hypothetical protein [Sphingomonas sp.]
MHKWNRRNLLGSAGAAAVLGGFPVAGAPPRRTVAIVAEPNDPVAGSPQIRWAIELLVASLEGHGAHVTHASPHTRLDRGTDRIILAGFASSAAQRAFVSVGIRPAAVVGATAIIPVGAGPDLALLAAGHDISGLVYAILELADRLRHGTSPGALFATARPVVEQPHNQVRSISRLFASDVEDLSWFHDRAMWRAYFTMLATHRFNRFQLSFGQGYDFIRQVTDAYFLFAYPFLVGVPGYDVRVPQITDDERARNLATLKYISDECAAHGIEFQLGIWTHGYVWEDSPNAKHTVEGLTPQTHAAYCRDALRLVLQSCPAISGVTFRVHGESGVPEGNFDFWRIVFDGVVTCGRPIRVDMHTKGMTQDMLDIAVATGQAVTVSPKYWAEHLGMPYHQAEIRASERQQPGRPDASTGLMRLSAGSRSFLRYGYGDLLREDRKWQVVHRIWPGTQRLLLWGDPQSAAAYSRAFTFCGSNGVEICEPLSFKGRRGSGLPGGRCAYADTSLNPHWDWQKYSYTYRVWGRLLYNPAATPDTWRRKLDFTFGRAAPHLEIALASASRILPTVTTAHDPSAANNGYWPEIYINQSLIDAEHYEPYS